MSLAKNSVKFPYLQKCIIHSISVLQNYDGCRPTCPTTNRSLSPPRLKDTMPINNRSTTQKASIPPRIRRSFFHTMPPLSQVHDDNSSPHALSPPPNDDDNDNDNDNDDEGTTTNTTNTIPLFEEENLSVLAEDITNLTKSKNGGYEAAQKAEQLLHQMEQVAKARGSNPPSVFLYNQVVSMYGQENRPRDAERLLRKMQHLASHNHNPRAQPDRVTYNACISAWATHSGTSSSNHNNNNNNNVAHRAESLLREMVSIYRQGLEYRRKNRNQPQQQQHPHDENLTKNDDIDEEEETHNDGDDDDDLLLRPDVWSFNATIAAWARDDRNSHRAYDILNEMIRFSELVPEVKPDTVTLSSVIRALCKSKRRGAIQEAEAILDRMEILADAGDDTVRPDAISYTTLMIGLATQKPKYHDAQKKRGNHTNGSSSSSSSSPTTSEDTTTITTTDKVIRLLKRMDDRYQEQGDVGVKPDTVAFNAVLLAIANSGEQDCGENAERLLQKMHALHKKGNNDVCPTAISYSTTMLAWKNSGLLDAGDRAEALLRQMQKYYYDHDDYVDLEPNTVCFSTVISTFANSGTHHGAERAESLLEEMLQLYGSGSHDKVQPNTVTYTSVIEAWVATGRGGAIERAEKIVEQMEELSASGNKNVAPSTITYNLLIKGVEKCQVVDNTNKAEKAHGILQRMQDRYDSRDCHAKPNVRTYNAVFQACAATPSDSNNDTKQHAIMVVLNLLRDMKERNIDVDKYTYPAAMKACANLYNNNNNNDYSNAAIDEIFQRCCHDGMLDPMVLSHVRRVAPQYLEKVTGMPATSVKLEKVPNEWSARIRRKRRKFKR